MTFNSLWRSGSNLGDQSQTSVEDSIPRGLALRKRAWGCRKKQENVCVESAPLSRSVLRCVRTPMLFGMLSSKGRELPRGQSQLVSHLSSLSELETSGAAG